MACVNSVKLTLGKAVMAGEIRVGIGGWTFEPWRETFYPKELRQKDELNWASRRLTAIEVNGTYYSGFKPETFAKGIGELGDRLGPILWQFANTKKFDPDDFARFLDLLPAKLGERPLRHALEVRHESFRDARFVDLARERGMAICLADHEVYPLIEAATADFVYARLMRGDEANPACYPADDLAAWKDRLVALAADGRDVFAFFISGGKPRAPMGAMAMIEALR